jgi:dTDP-4-amino-4,6-dideoxygalactose transaminase
MLSRPTVPFIDLQPALGPIRAEIDAAIAAVNDSTIYLRGIQTAAFEEEWAAYCGQNYCVTCNSGTDALTLAAAALEMKRAKVQANTLSLTAIGLDRGGSKVMVEDVDSAGRCCTPDRETVPVLLYGRLPSVAETGSVLFDAAHAHGWNPPPHATACWSFYPTKSLGALGDGGAVTTNDAQLAREMRALSGRDDRFHDERQITSRMDEIQAAVLRVKLRHLDEWIAQRQALGRHYRQRLPPSAEPVSVDEGDLQHLFVVRVSNRAALMSRLTTMGIVAKVHFPVPLHLHKGRWHDPTLRCPVAERWCDSVLSLPCYPGLTANDVDYVCGAIDRFDADQWL